MESKKLLGKLKMFMAVLVSTLIVLTGVLLLIPKRAKNAMADGNSDGTTLTFYTADGAGNPVDLLEVDNSVSDVEFWMNIKVSTSSPLPISAAEINLYYDTNSYSFLGNDRYEGVELGTKYDMMSTVDSDKSVGGLFMCFLYNVDDMPNGEDLLWRAPFKLLSGKHPRKFELDKGFCSTPLFVEDTNILVFDQSLKYDLSYFNDVEFAKEHNLNTNGAYNQLNIEFPDLKSVESVTLDRTTYHLEVDGTVQLTPTVLPADALDKNVIWTTSESAVATVVNGLVTAVGAGTAKITVTTADGNKTAECLISVSAPVSVEKVELNETVLSIVKGNSYTLEATVLPEDAANRNKSWTSSNEAVATVEGGVVKAIAEGTATITVTTEDGGKTATCSVMVTDSPIAVTGVTLSSGISVTVGNTATLTATLQPLYATNRNVSWSSDNTAVATVSASGVVTAKKVGTANITVTTEDGGYTATCQVTVNPVAVTGITLNKSNESVKINNTLTITAAVAPSNATNKNVVWTSSNEAVATVANGVITGVSDGDIIITATTEDGGYTATCAINVYTTPISVANVAVEATASIKVGESVTLSHTLSPSNATNKNVTWSSSDPAVAQVNNGTVVGRKAGTAQITVTSEDGGKTATCTVTVSAVPVTGVSVSNTLSLRIGNSTTLTATVTPSNATNKALSWSSSNTAVATVVDGVVTARSVGNATITVTAADGGYTASCALTVVDGDVSVTGVTLSRETATIDVGETYTLTADVLPDNATNKTVSWTSSDESVATVANGVITALKAGTATITVTTEQGNAAKTCVVTVNNVNVESVTLNKTTLTMVKNNSTSLTATVSPANATNKVVSWTSSNQAVATVVGGVVNAKSAGTATITVTTQDGSKQAICTLTVVDTAVDVTAIQLNSTSKQLNVGETFTLTATVKPNNATFKGVNWVTSDETVATVANGVVTAVGAGTCDISAISEDGKAANTCSFEIIAPQISVTKVTLNTSVLKLEEGDNATLTATVAPSNATNKTVSWTSSNQDVATVSNGVVTAVSKGTATITATTADGGFTSSCTVKVVEQVSKPSLNIYASYDAAGENVIENLGTVDNSANEVAFFIIYEITMPDEGVFESAEAYIYLDQSVYQYVGYTLSNKLNKGNSSIYPSSYSDGDGNYTGIMMSLMFERNMFSESVRTDRSVVLSVKLKQGQQAVPFTIDRELINDEAEVTFLMYGDSEGYDHRYFTDVQKGYEYYENNDTDVVHSLYYQLPEVSAPSDDTTISWVKVGGVEADWNAEKSCYEYTVASNVSSVAVTAEAVSPATISAGTGDVSSLVVGENEVTITVKAESGKLQNYKLVITREVPVTGVSIDKIKLDMVKGAFAALVATVSPEDAANKSITWSSSNQGVVSCSAGAICAVGAGTATVTATTEDGGFTATCLVTVTESLINVTGVSLDATIKSLTIGESFTLGATVAPAGATNKEISWSSSDEDVAVVVNGVVTAVSEGTATITVTTADGSKTATCAVTVSAISVTGVTIDSTLSLMAGNSATLTATVSPDNATNKAVSWSSDNTAVAQVVGGVVTALSEGTAHITVTTADGSKTAVCTVTVEGIEISVTGVTLDVTGKNLSVGDTLTLTATVLPDGATNKTVSWSSDNTAVATVVNGVVTAIGVGTATITVTTADGSKTAVCAVSVHAKSVTGVTLDSTSVSLVIGDSTTLSATIIPGDADNTAISWSSSDEDVAVVVNGVVTAVSEGTATITVTTADGHLTATCTVTVVSEAVAVTGVTLNETSKNLSIGETLTLTATVSPDDATYKTVNWASNDSAVATVANGVVTAIGVGTATITAITAEGGFSATCVITVSPVAVTGVTLDNSSLTIVKDSNAVLVATVAPAEAGNQGVSWTSSNQAVATVVNGVVTAVSEGSATITVTTEDGGFTATCTVTVVNEAVAVESVSLDVTEKTDLLVGDELTLTATVLPATATNKAISWSSSDEDVAVVVNGVVTAVSAGSATITVTTADGSKTAICNLTISDIKVSKIELDKAQVYVVKYDSTSVIATITPSNATNKNVVWTSSNTSIATVSSTGVITGVGVGTTTIFVTTEDGNKNAHCTVTVYAEAVNVTGVTLDTTAVSELKVGKTVTLTATIAPVNATNTALIWTSDDESVVKVSGGVVTAVGEGSATVTVTSQDGGFTATCTVTTIDFKLTIENTSKLFFATYDKSGGELSNLANDKAYENVPEGKTVYLTGFDKSMVGNNGFGRVTRGALVNQLATANVRVYNTDGNLLASDNDVITTNCKVVLVDDDGSVLQTAVVIIRGDINCDGNINANDIAWLQLAIAGYKNEAKEYELAAADTDRDGSGEGVLNAYDITNVQMHMAKNTSLFPNA